MVAEPRHNAPLTSHTVGGIGSLLPALFPDIVSSSSPPRLALFRSTSSSRLGVVVADFDFCHEVDDLLLTFTDTDGRPPDDVVMLTCRHRKEQRAHDRTTFVNYKKKPKNVRGNAVCQGVYSLDEIASFPRALQQQ